jgi:hypothetical protein
MTDRVLVRLMHHMHAIVRTSAPIFRAGLAMALLGGAASGEDRGTAEERRACTPDVLKHCNAFIPDAERVTVCLHEKLRELSPECRVVMIGARKR